MKVKATTSFAGNVSLHKGEEREMESGQTLSALLKAGYVEPLETDKEPADPEADEEPADPEADKEPAELKAEKKNSTKKVGAKNESK